jgi:low-affinity ferrous iron transport protein
MVTAMPEGLSRKERLMQVLRKPGSKSDIHGAAPTQRVHDGKSVEENVTGFIPEKKKRKLDRWLDFVVRTSGSQIVFFTLLAGLATWALLGVRYGLTNIWQVLISDIQAILNYIFDTFLVRQQLNGYNEEMLAAAQIESRMMSHDRMLGLVSESIEKGDLAMQSETSDTLEYEAELPRETRFGHYVTTVSRVLGHLSTVALYWAGVIVWIGIGPMEGFSSSWLLYMNSASSALMVFIFTFIMNIRERHSAYTRKCLNAIFLVDSALEVKLRSLTGDTLDNDVVIIPAPKVNRIQRGIFYYADFVGTLLGIAILIVVLAVWVAIGPALQFSDNWWLISGTYAGLIGLNDGFVLRNLQNRLGGPVNSRFAKLSDADEKLFELTGLPSPDKELVKDTSLTARISEIMDRVSAHELTVVAGFLVILGLIAGSSAMKWSTTGQLLCNVPPSLIESFFMLILITGHNSVDGRKRINLRNIYERRLRLLLYVNRIQVQKDGPGNVREKGSDVDKSVLVTVSRT